MSLKMYALDGDAINIQDVCKLSVWDKQHGSITFLPSHMPVILHLTQATLRIVTQKQLIHHFELSGGCLLIPILNKVCIAAHMLKKVS